jgi:hypothetical protein
MARRSDVLLGRTIDHIAPPGEKVSLLFMLVE